MKNLLDDNLNYSCMETEAKLKGIGGMGDDSHPLETIIAKVRRLDCERRNKL